MKKENRTTPSVVPKLKIEESKTENFLAREITLARCPVCQRCYPSDEEHKCFKFSSKSDISKMVHIELSSFENIDKPEFNRNIENLHRQFAAQCVDISDKVILEAVIATAKAEGITDLFLLDKAFVMSALKKALNEENYCKQTNVAERIFEELKDLAKMHVFPVVREGMVEIEKEPFWCIDPADFAKLEKKYTEDTV